METDAAAIAARVSRPRADTTDIVINEQTVRDACMSPPCILTEEDADNSLDIQGPIAAAYWTVVDIR